MKRKHFVAIFVVIVLACFYISPVFTMASSVENPNSDDPDTSVSDISSDESIPQPSEPEEPSSSESEPEEPVSSEPEVSSEVQSEVVSSEASVPEPQSSTTIEYPTPSSSTAVTSSASKPSRNTSSEAVPSEEEPDEPIYVVSIPDDVDLNVSSDVSSVDTSSAFDDVSSEDEMVLPDISPEDISVPQVIGSVTDDDKSSKDNLLKGMIAWACIGIGVVLVLTVIFGSSYSKQSAKNKRVKGRKHYKASKTKRKKRLLSDKYYYR